MARSYGWSRACPTACSAVAAHPARMPLPASQHLLRRGRISLAGQVYHVTTTTQCRAPLFAGFDMACAASRAFESPALLRDSTLLAWVLMPDHAHWLLQLGSRDSLPALVARLKSGSARAANAVRGCRGRIWSKAYFDHAVRREESLEAIARYIVANPQRAGLVHSARLYPFWNAVYL